MKTGALIAILSLSAVVTAFTEPSDKEAIAIMNRVQRKVAGGDVGALDELTTLPGSMSAPAFLTIFKQNYNVYGATAQNRAIGLKAAQLATSVPGGEEYLVKLLRKKPDNSPNWVLIQQDTGIKALIATNNKTSVRILCGALDEVDIGGKAANALATMGLPGAPYSSKSKSDTSTPQGVQKWKQWWAENADSYAAGR